jgi:CubicO group peptidase (beta-lactamase class C family)
MAFASEDVSTIPAPSEARLQAFYEANRARYATALPTDPTSGQPQNVDMGLIAPQFECGGGCAVSTAADYIRFAQMLLNGGALDGRRVLSRASVAEMTRDHMHAGIQNNLTNTIPAGWAIGGRSSL